MKKSLRVIEDAFVEDAFVQTTPEVRFLHPVRPWRAASPEAPEALHARLAQLQEELSQMREELWRLTRENQQQAALLSNYRLREIELRRQVCSKVLCSVRT